MKLFKKMSNVKKIAGVVGGILFILLLAILVGYVFFVLSFTSGSFETNRQRRCSCVIDAKRSVKLRY